MTATFYTGTNRVAAAIGDLRERVAALGEVAAADLNAEMAVTSGEHFAYQTQQSRAAAGGRLNVDESLTVYVALGEVGSAANGGWAASTDLATKVAVTMLMGELMAR